MESRVNTGQCVVYCIQDWRLTLQIVAWVESGGVVGRGVLLDYAAWADAKGIETRAFETVSIPVSTLKEVAASQGTTFERGDILFIRSGWNREYKALPENGRQTLADYEVPPAIGVESSEETFGGSGTTRLPPLLATIRPWKRGRART